MRWDNKKEPGWLGRKIEQTVQKVKKLLVGFGSNEKTTWV
jgi:hypothetical protein